MPDHVHLLVKIGSSDSSLKTAIAAWKSWTRKKLGLNWQQGFFEHRIRSDSELDLKFEYIANNPVRAGLVKKAEEWPWKLESFLG